MRRFFLTFLIFVVASLALAKENKKADPVPVMADVTVRGRLLYECDQAAWHASDAVQALNPPKEALGQYIAHKGDSGWAVAFGHLNDARDKFLVAYEATEGATLQEFSAKKFDPPREDAAFYLFAARAIDTALKDFHGENRPYNAAVLTAPGDKFYVYVMPAQTQDDVYPLGGDVRYLMSSDGNAIVEKRQLHKTILEEKRDLPKGATKEAGFHTHVLSDVPEDTDVFHVLTQRPAVPEYVGTQNKKTFLITTDGTIYETKI